MPVDVRVRSFRVTWSCPCDSSSYVGFNIALCEGTNIPTENPLKIITVKPPYNPLGTYSYLFSRELVSAGNFEVWVQLLSTNEDSMWRSVSGFEISDDGIGTIAGSGIEDPVVYESSVYEKDVFADVAGHISNDLTGYATLWALDPKITSTVEV